MKKSVWALSLLLTTLSAGAMAAKGTVTVYKSPTCGCCGQWAEGVEKPVMMWKPILFRRRNWKK